MTASPLQDIALLFPEFFAKAPHWKIAVVSGDADSAVPFMGTERWIECLGRNVVKDWRNWFLNGDVAGSVINYENIALVTVKGAGHTIPTCGYGGGASNVACGGLTKSLSSPRLQTSPSPVRVWEGWGYCLLSSSSTTFKPSP